MSTKIIVVLTVRKSKMMMMMMRMLRRPMKKAKMKLTRNNGNKKKESNKIMDQCRSCNLTSSGGTKWNSRTKMRTTAPKTTMM